MAPKPYEIIRFGDTHGPKPYEFKRFGDFFLFLFWGQGGGREDEVPTGSAQELPVEDRQVAPGDGNGGQERENGEEGRRRRRYGMSRSPLRARRGQKSDHIGPSRPHPRLGANGKPSPGLPLRDAKMAPPNAAGAFDPNGPSVPQTLRVLPCPAEQYGPPCEGGPHWGARTRCSCLISRIVHHLHCTMMLSQLLPCIFLYGSLVLSDVCSFLTHPFIIVITNVLSTMVGPSTATIGAVTIATATTPIVSAIIIPVYTSAIISCVSTLATIVLSSLSLCNT